MSRQVEGTFDAESRIEGRVRLEAGGAVERSVVRGPAVIGRGTMGRDSFIGPVGDGCQIEGFPHRALRHPSTVIHSTSVGHRAPCQRGTPAKGSVRPSRVPLPPSCPERAFDSPLLPSGLLLLRLSGPHGGCGPQCNGVRLVPGRTCVRLIRVSLSIEAGREASGG